MKTDQIDHQGRRYCFCGRQIMIRIAVCDDNAKMLKQIKQSVETAFLHYTNDFELYTYENGKLLLHENEYEPFQVIFLDIDMPTIDGFEIARNLRNEEASCFIIFVTSYSELVYQSFDFHPFHFIRKHPDELFDKTVQKVVGMLMKQLKQNHQIVLEDEEHGKRVTYYRNILYIKSEKHYLYYYLKGENVPVKMRGMLPEIEVFFSEYDFIRAHRNFIINLNCIQRLDLKIGAVYLSDGKEVKRIPMSKSFQDIVDKKYTEYLRRTL